MISGALLLPITKPTRQFISRRMTRIIIPLVAWTIIYIAIYTFMAQSDVTDIFFQIINIPIGSTIGFVQGWYLYLLIGVYLFLPIINSWLKENSQKRALYYIVPWGIVMSSPYIIAIFGNFNPDTFAPFAGYFGYVILGYYLHNHPLQPNSAYRKITFASIVILISGILPAIMYFTEIPDYDTYHQIIYNYLSISTVIMCAFIYVFIQNHHKIGHLVYKAVKSFSELSFGIYLINYVIIDKIFRPYFIDNPLSNVETEIVITFTGSAALSYLTAWLIRKLPFGKYITG